MSCFGCTGGDIPSDYVQLPRHKLKALYDKSVLKNDNRLIVSGIFARADKNNTNARIYPKAVIQREVDRFEQKHVQNGTALGELDHPDYSSRYFKSLSLPNISHQVIEVHWEGEWLYGTIEILQTPSGLLLWELYSKGIILGVSSRGWASLSSPPGSSIMVVDKDFELITFDFVAEPATANAFLIPIQKRYKGYIHDQAKMVQISHLGHGACLMENIPKLPNARILASRISMLQTLQPHSPGEIPALLQRPPIAALASAALGSNNLDNLLCHSHYIVHKNASYLDLEPSARDYLNHRAMFAAHAYVSASADGR